MAYVAWPYPELLSVSFLPFSPVSQFFCPCFVLDTHIPESPDPATIPTTDLVGVTVTLITCCYKQKEFIRVGYYVNNEHTDPAINAEIQVILVCCLLQTTGSYIVLELSSVRWLAGPYENLGFNEGFKDEYMI